MAVQRWSNLKFQLWVSKLNSIDEARKIPFEMHAERQKVGDHGDVSGSAGSEGGRGGSQIGLAKFEECRFD